MTIPDCQQVLPPAPGGKEMTAESMLWLLLTGKVPTPDQSHQLSAELAEKGELPHFVAQLIDSYVPVTVFIICSFTFVASLPKTLHPMTQLGMGVAALNHDSKFQAAYERGIKKSEYWTYTLEDCLNLIAKLPALAARIYRNVYHPERSLESVDKNLDLVG